MVAWHQLHSAACDISMAIQHGQLSSISAGAAAEGSPTQHDNTCHRHLGSRAACVPDHLPQTGLHSSSTRKDTACMAVSWTGKGPWQLCITQGHIKPVPDCPLPVAGSSCQQVLLATTTQMRHNQTVQAPRSTARRHAHRHIARTLLTWGGCYPAGAASWRGPSPVQCSACPWQPQFLQRPCWHAPATCAPGPQVSLACTPMIEVWQALL